MIKKKGYARLDDGNNSDIESKNDDSPIELQQLNLAPSSSKHAYDADDAEDLEAQDQFEPEADLDEDQISIFIQLPTVKRKAIVTMEDTIASLKERAFAEELKDGKRIVLLYMGRVLEDGETVVDCNLNEGVCLSCMIRNKPAGGNADGRRTNGNNVADDADADADADAAGRGGIPAILIGGDRAAAVRRQQWLADQPRGRGTTTDFFIGLCLGSVFGILMLLWFWSGRVSFKLKAGILLGIIAHTLLSMSNFFYQPFNPYDNDYGDGSGTGSGSGSGSGSGGGSDAGGSHSSHDADTLSITTTTSMRAISDHYSTTAADIMARLHRRLVQ